MVEWLRGLVLVNFFTLWFRLDSNTLKLCYERYASAEAWSDDGAIITVVVSVWLQWTVRLLQDYSLLCNTASTTCFVCLLPKYFPSGAKCRLLSFSKLFLSRPCKCKSSIIELERLVCFLSTSLKEFLWNWNHISFHLFKTYKQPNSHYTTLKVLRLTWFGTCTQIGCHSKPQCSYVFKQREHLGWLLMHL